MQLTCDWCGKIEQADTESLRMGWSFIYTQTYSGETSIKDCICSECFTEFHKTRSARREIAHKMGPYR